jgi:enoyl-CoA hydratase/carnithine racemase
MPMGSSQREIVYDLEGAVARVRLNRPEKLNAFTFAMIDALREAVGRAAADERAAAIVITGTGRAFSAGLDLADLARSTREGLPASSGSPEPDELPALFGYLLQVPKPVIAAVNGVAAGGGFLLAMMCDLRFAAAGASFTTAFSRRGLIAEHGTSWILPRLIGTSRVLDLLWSSRRIDAAEALRVGLVDRVVPEGRLLEEVDLYAGDLAANVSGRSLAVIKSQVYRGLSWPLEEACRDADRRMREALAHPDAKEGAASFAERRPPRFARWRGGPA